MVEVTKKTNLLPASLELLAERVVDALQKEAARFTAPGVTPKIALKGVQFTQVIDPSNQLPGFEGIWRNARNERCGAITFNSDGSFYAEYDLFCQHPRDSRWFVEMVTAWGNDGLLHCEATLQPCM